MNAVPADGKIFTVDNSGSRAPFPVMSSTAVLHLGPPQQEAGAFERRLTSP